MIHAIDKDGSELKTGDIIKLDAIFVGAEEDAVKYECTDGDSFTVFGKTLALLYIPWACEHVRVPLDFIADGKRVIEAKREGEA
jgi:hypothetical protein